LEKSPCRTPIEVEDELFETRSLVEAVCMAATDLDPEKRGPMTTLLALIRDRLAFSIAALVDIRGRADAS
jgi:hypothetical protein